MDGTSLEFFLFICLLQFLNCSSFWEVEWEFSILLVVTGATADGSNFSSFPDWVIPHVKLTTKKKIKVENSPPGERGRENNIITGFFGGRPKSIIQWFNWKLEISLLTFRSISGSLCRIWIQLSDSDVSDVPPVSYLKSPQIHTFFFVLFFFYLWLKSNWTSTMWKMLQ